MVRAAIHGMKEAQLIQEGAGLAPAAPGWFVVNARDAAWYTHAFGDACFFEGERAPFDQLGVGIRVLWPGRSTWLYHSESAQEDFLVLSGEALLLVEDEERPLRPWDFVHCPPGTPHAFVPVGTHPCVIVMAGARLGEHAYRYPRTPLAVAHGVAAVVETTSPEEAQTPFSDWKPSGTGAQAGLPWSESPGPPDD
ncbi:MAG: cupin domain-containing protein [Gaiellales bacterium]